MVPGGGVEPPRYQAPADFEFLSDEIPTVALFVGKWKLLCLPTFPAFHPFVETKADNLPLDTKQGTAKAWFIPKMVRRCSHAVRSVWNAKFC